ncbi:MAG: hypothetical protein ACRC10_11025 [Thermoguttaceae bacterium]
MFERLLKIAGIGALYLGASLFFSQLILLGYLTFAWKINSEKLNQMIAIAQGFDLFQNNEYLRRQVEDRIQQMSYQEVLQIRAERGLKEDYDRLKVNQMEDTILAQARQQEVRKKEIEAVAQNLETRISDLQDKSKSKGFTDVLAMIESLQPSLAKEQILEMIKNKEEEQVIRLLEAMEETPRKKLLNTMTSETEVTDLANLFQKMLNGGSQSQAVQDARDQLQKMGVQK